jgi:hypothetical protein
MPGPKSAARRRACQVVRGASTQRMRGNCTRPMPVADDLAGPVACSGDGPGPSDACGGVSVTGECHGASMPYGADQTGDHRKERKEPLPLTSEVARPEFGAGLG